MSRRTLRVASLIRSIVADAIQFRLNDPRIEPLTSVLRVDVSADFSVAKVYVSVMAGEARQKLTLDALRGAAGMMRSLVASDVTLRQTPALEFVLDGSLQRGFETVQAIDQAMRELRDADQPEPAPREIVADPSRGDALLSEE